MKQLSNTTRLCWTLCFLYLASPVNLHAQQTNRYRPMAQSMMEMMEAFSSAFQKKRDDSGNRGGSSSGNGIPWNGNALAWGMSKNSPWGMDKLPMASSMSPWGLSGMPMGNPMSPWNMGSMPMTPSLSPWSMNSMSRQFPWGMGSNDSALPDLRAFMPQGEGNPASSWWPNARSPLEGRWRDPQGHLFEVNGDRFRISRSASEQSEGRIAIQNERMLTLQPGYDQPGRRYEYATQEDRLVLRDEQGNLLLFRRE